MDEKIIHKVLSKTSPALVFLCPHNFLKDHTK